MCLRSRKAPDTVVRSTELEGLFFRASGPNPWFMVLPKQRETPQKFGNLPSSHRLVPEPGDPGSPVQDGFEETGFAGLVIWGNIGGVMQLALPPPPPFIVSCCSEVSSGVGVGGRRMVEGRREMVWVGPGLL